MRVPLRILDTGLLTARRNLALTAALAELHRGGVIPDTLRFQHFAASAIVGRHQSLAREVRLDRCREKGVETARRMTGGGAIYMGPGLLGWELIADRARLPVGLDAITRRLCTGLAGGLSGLGIAAAFRPRNDIEVDGRKISGTGGYIDGRTLVFQGTVLMDFDVADMADVLVLPTMKPGRLGLTAMADRVTSLRVLLGQSPPVEEVCAAVTQGVTEGLAGVIGSAPERGILSDQEQSLADRLYDEEIGTEAFVAGSDCAIGDRTIVRSRQIPAGMLEVSISIRQPTDDRISRIWIMGDFFATPPRAIPDLEAALVGVRVSQASSVARSFLASRPVELLGGTIDDITAVIADAASVIEHGVPIP